MSSKCLLIFVFMLILSMPSYAESRFFIEAGIGSKLIDGSLNYQSDNSVYYSDFGQHREPLELEKNNSNVTSNSFLNWENKYLLLLNGSIGYRVSQSYSLVVSFVYFHTKEGYKDSRYYIRDTTGIVPGGISNSPELNNRYKQYNFRLAHHFVLKKSISIIAGGELIRLNVSYVNDTGRPDTQGGLIRADLFPGPFSDHIIGLIGGFGYELRLSKNSSLYFNSIYSFAEYKEDGMYIKDLEFDVGGFELSTSYRYDIF